MGLRIALWNVDPQDYAKASGAELTAWFRNHPLQGGDIVLLHDRLPFLAEALPELISSARDSGLDFIPLEES
jgi:hypothetical protein